MALVVLAICTFAAMLFGLGMGLSLYVECCALRAALAHANTTQHRIARLEGGRYRALKRSADERESRRAAHEERIATYARASSEALGSIHALLGAFLAGPDDTESSDKAEALFDSEDEPTKVLTAPEPALLAASLDRPQTARTAPHVAPTLVSMPEAS